jgi:hypothetical protein
VGVLSLGSFGLQCLGDFDYVDYMYGITILPLMVLGLFFVCFKRYEISRFMNKEGPEIDPHTKIKFQIKIANFVHMFIFLILPAVSCAIFRMFPCQVRAEKYL